MTQEDNTTRARNFWLEKDRFERSKRNSFPFPISRRASFLEPCKEEKPLSASLPVTPEKKKDDDSKKSQSLPNTPIRTLSLKKTSSFHLSTESEAVHVFGRSGSDHASERAEAAAFSTYINNKLRNDPLLSHILPLNPESVDIFTKNKDGLMLVRLINGIKEVIDMNCVHKESTMSISQQTENLDKAIAGAAQIGCNITNIMSSDIFEGR
jgi:hypothetical protein